MHNNHFVRRDCDSFHKAAVRCAPRLTQILQNPTLSSRPSLEVLWILVGMIALGPLHEQIRDWVDRTNLPPIAKSVVYLALAVGKATLETRLFDEPLMGVASCPEVLESGMRVLIALGHWWKQTKR